MTEKPNIFNRQVHEKNLRRVSIFYVFLQKIFNHVLAFIAVKYVSYNSVCIQPIIIVKIYFNTIIRVITIWIHIVLHDAEISVLITVDCYS